MCDKTSFASMKKVKHKFAPPVYESEETDMIRSGKSGDSRQVLGPTMSERVDNFCRDLFLEAAPDFPYDEFYCQGASTIGGTSGSWATDAAKVAV